jgi:hypothetical protein
VETKKDLTMKKIIGILPIVLALACLAVLLSGLFISRPALADDPWNGGVLVHDDSPPAATRSRPALAASPMDASVLAVWVDDRHGDDGIYFARSADGGQSWGDSIWIDRNITGSPAPASSPDIAYDPAGPIHVVWLGVSNAIYYARSEDGGLTWSAKTSIGTVGSADVSSPAIAVLTDTICVAWNADPQYDSPGIYVTCSFDGGHTWGTSTRVSDDTSGVLSHYHPDIALASSGRVHVVWDDARAGDPNIFYAYSDDGSSWSANARLNHDGLHPTVQESPALAVSGNATYVVWKDERGGAGSAELYANTSTDAGRTWQASDQAVSDGGVVSDEPVLAVTGHGTVWAAWRVISGTQSILYADQGGSTWGRDVAVLSSTALKQHLALAAGSDQPCLAWSASTNILSSRRTTAWGAPVQVNDTGFASQQMPALAAGSTGSLYAVWSDTRAPGTPLYAARSTDGGQTWLTNTQVPGSRDGLWPALAVQDAMTLHVAWRSDVTGGWRVHYTSSGDGGQSWASSQLLAANPNDSFGSATPNKPAMAVTSSTIYVAWPSQGQLVLARSGDGGGTWVSSTLPFTPTAYGWPSLAVDPAGRLHLAWAYLEDYGLCYARSSNGGVDWEAYTCFHGPARTFLYLDPGLAAEPLGSRVHLVWTRRVWEQRRSSSAAGMLAPRSRGDLSDHVYHSVSSDAGLSWEESRQVDDVAYSVSSPAVVAVGDGVVYVAWGRGESDIYWARTTNAGVSWQPSGRANDGTGPAFYPALASNYAYSSTRVWAGWQDFRNNNWDVYAATLVDSCPVPLDSASIAGDSTVAVNTPLTLTGIISPANATTHVSGYWDAPYHLQQSGTSASFTWATEGHYTVTYRASNCGGVVMAQKAVTVPCPLVFKTAEITGPVRAQAGSLLKLELLSGPPSGGYVSWSPQPDAGQYTRMAEYVVHALGPQTFTATVRGCWSAEWDGLVATYTVEVYDDEYPEWSDFQPAGWVSKTLPGGAVPFTITVQDGGGLDVGTAQVSFNEGAGWSAWQPISCTGSVGTFDPQTITGQHAFAHDSGAGHANRVRFQIADLAGNEMPSAGYAVDLDLTPPTNPTSISVDRPIQTWSNQVWPVAVFEGASDGPYGSALRYVHAWTHYLTTTVPTPPTYYYTSDEVTATAGIPYPYDGQDWYLHVRVQDAAGWWADGTTHSGGPYWIDRTEPPTLVDFISSDPPVNECSNDNTVAVSWNRPVDAAAAGSAASGVNAYSFMWGVSGSPYGVTPDMTPELTTTAGVVTATSEPLYDAQGYYFFLRSRDAAGNWSGGIYRGPFSIDTSPPSTPTLRSSSAITNVWSTNDTITLSWESLYTGPCESYDYSFVWDTTAGTVPDTEPELLGVGMYAHTTSSPLADGQNHYFHVRSRDKAGNWSGAAHLGPFWVDASPPPAPLIHHSDPISRQWTADNTILVAWSYPSDGAGIGTRYYSYEWDDQPDTEPDTSAELDTPFDWGLSTTSDARPNGQTYFHIRAGDLLGNWGQPTHYGPFLVDRTPAALFASHGSGAPGSDVILTGLVYPSSVTVTLYLAEGPAASRSSSWLLGPAAPQLDSAVMASRTLGSFQSSPDRTFQVLATLPSDVEEGDYHFVAEGGGKSAQDDFTVVHGMKLSVQPSSLAILYGSKNLAVHLSDLNPQGALVIETDMDQVNGPFQLNGTESTLKTVSVSRAYFSGTHTLTATTRINGLAVQRATADFVVTHVISEPPPPSSMTTNITHAIRGAQVQVSGFNNWVRRTCNRWSDVDDFGVWGASPRCEEESIDSEGVWDEASGMCALPVYKLEWRPTDVPGTSRAAQSPSLNMPYTGHFDGSVRVNDGYNPQSWDVGLEMPYRHYSLCLTAKLVDKHREANVWHSPYVNAYSVNEQCVTDLIQPPQDIACVPFTLDQAPFFAGSYTLRDSKTKADIPYDRAPQVFFLGEAVGTQDGEHPVKVKQSFARGIDTPSISVSLPEGRYDYTAFACGYTTRTGSLSARGTPAWQPIELDPVDALGPPVVGVEPSVTGLAAGKKTFLSNQGKIGPFLSLKDVSLTNTKPSVELVVDILLDPNIATVSAVEACIGLQGNDDDPNACVGNVQPTSIVPVTANTLWQAKWNVSELPPGQLTMWVRAIGKFLGAEACGEENQPGPYYKKAVIMAAPPPWLNRDWLPLREVSYNSPTGLYTMKGGLFDVDKNADIGLGFLGTVQNHVVAEIDVTEHLDITSGVWDATVPFDTDAQVMCYAGLGQCSGQKTLTMVAVPQGGVVDSATAPSYPDKYLMDPATQQILYYPFGPFEVYNGMLATYGGIVNVYLSVNFGGNVALNATPQLMADFSPQIELLPSATINGTIDLWVDILCGVASAGVSAQPSLTLAMPITVKPPPDPVSFSSDPRICFRLYGSVWVRALFWKETFGPFNILETGNCTGLMAQAFALLSDTPPPSVMPAPALASDGYGHVLGTWVHDASNDPTKSEGRLYAAYFDGANWHDPVEAAGSPTLLVSDPAVAFASDDNAVAVYAVNSPNSTRPLTWTDVTEQLEGQRIAYSTLVSGTWSQPAYLTPVGGGPRGRVTLAGDPERKRALAAWVHDVSTSSLKKWQIEYAVYTPTASGGYWSEPGVVYAPPPDGSLDAEVALAFDSTGRAMAVWVRQAGVQAGDGLTSPFTRNSQRKLVTTIWDPVTWQWSVTTSPADLPTGALMPDVAFDGDDQPILAYALYKTDRDGTTPTGLGNNNYLGYAVGSSTRAAAARGAQGAQAITWQTGGAPDVRGVERPSVLMTMGDEASIVYRGFGAPGTPEFNGTLMATTIDLRDVGELQVSLSGALTSGNGWMHSAVAAKSKYTGGVNVVTLGASLGGQAASARASGAQVQALGLPGDDIVAAHVPVLPDLSVTVGDIVFSETLPLPGRLVPFSVTVRNLGLARTHQPVAVRLIQDVGRPWEKEVASGTVPSGTLFNGSYVLSGTWQAQSGLHTFTARLSPPVDDDVEGSNNEARLAVGVPPAPADLVGSPNPYDRSLGLAWPAVEGPAMGGYRVYRAEGANQLAELADTAGTAYHDADVRADVVYTYAVSAVSSAGVESGKSAVLVLKLPLHRIYLPTVVRQQ